MAKFQNTGGHGSKRAGMSSAPMSSRKVTAGLPKVSSATAGKRPGISASGAASASNVGANSMGTFGGNPCCGKRPL